MYRFLYISHQDDGLGVWFFKIKELAEHAMLLDVLDTISELGTSIELSNRELLDEAWGNRGYELDAGTNCITMYLRRISSE